MSTAVHLSLEEYLNTDYEPDCDYVDGEIVERNVGEKKHSRLQGLLLGFFLIREKQWEIRAYPEQRVQVSEKRFRIPDVCITRADAPDEQIFTHPPVVCVEILSKDDRMGDMLGKIKDYLAMGVATVWVIDPDPRRGTSSCPTAITTATPGGCARLSAARSTASPTECTS